MKLQSMTNTELNVKPYIRLFETSVDELLKMRRKITAKIQDTEDQVLSTENSRSTSMVELNRGYLFFSIPSKLS